MCTWFVLRKSFISESNKENFNLFSLWCLTGSSVSCDSRNDPEFVMEDGDDDSNTAEHGSDDYSSGMLIIHLNI